MLKEIFEQPTARARHASSAASRSRPAQVFLDEMSDLRRRPRGDRQGHAARLRHVVARGAGRQVHDRGAGPHPGRGRLRLRVPLPQPDRQRARRWRSRSRSPARPPTRWPRCARRKAQGRAQPGHLQRRRQHGHARGRRARSTPTPGPEIGVASTKAFTTPARRAATCWRCISAEVRGTLSQPSAASRTSTALMQLPQVARRQRCKRAKQIEEHRRAVPQPHRLPVPGPRHQLPDRARRRAQAQGDLLHPRRRLSGRRDEARPDRAHRRDRCRWSRWRPHDHVFEKMLGNIQEAKARGGSVIAITTDGDDDAVETARCED